MKQTRSVMSALSTPVIYPADVAVEHAEVVVVAPVNHAVADGDFSPPFLRRIHRLLEHLVQRCRAEAARALVFRNPFGV